MKPMISVAAMTGLLEAIRDAAPTPIRSCEHSSWNHRSRQRRWIYPMLRVCSHYKKIRARQRGRIFWVPLRQAVHSQNIGPLAYAVLNSPTVGEADAQVARYIKLYNQAGQASVIIEGQRAYMRYVLTGLDIPTARQQNRNAMAARLNPIPIMWPASESLSRSSSRMKARQIF